ncbi:hypothetical protein INT45_011232 [Circinella minor]|uniref:Uncharacterized protein n=1 Tax=Circinella minor TaxID=1195481 RepID=A0A8H7VPY8_9FUNG|nr:hypothetical protein INT45_011232 [Circinella minor]
MVNINIIDKMKNQIGMWRISRYTKRRTYVTIEGDQPYYPQEDVENEKNILARRTTTTTTMKGGRGGKTRATRFNNNNNNNRDATHLLTTNESDIIDYNKRLSRSNYSESYSITAAPL